MSDDTYRPSDNHWTVRKFRERVTKEQLQDMLLNTPDPIKNGHIHKWEYEKVGPGIYEFWMGDPKDFGDSDG